MAEEINNLGAFLRIVNSLRDDGALEREDWLLLLPLVIQLCEKLRVTLDDKIVLCIMLAGAQKVFEEVQDVIRESE